MKVKVGKKVIDFIFIEETGGKKYYDKFSLKPIWPKGSSGITVGGGYDCGYKTAAQIKNDWHGLIPDKMIKVLQTVAGLTGQRAANALTSSIVNSVIIPYDVALQQYQTRVIQKEVAKAVKAFPESDKLNPDALGVLASVVYNRGTDMTDNDKKAQDRKEMRAIKTLIPYKDYNSIANQIRSMKRLWDGVPDYVGDVEKKFGGLLHRRDKEAEIIEKSDRNYEVSEIVEFEI